MELMFNKYQTELDSLNSELPEEVITNISGALSEYKYLRYLTSVDRPTINEAKKDEDGLVIINFQNPHILLDMEYFMQPAIKFLKTGKYTDVIKSKHKKSTWAQYWKEEGIKCLTRVVNPATGEWITGDFYFYLNYSPIMKLIQNDVGEIIDRVFQLPSIYDGDYLYYHYIYQARHYKDSFIQGKHGSVIKCRGRGYSFKGSSKLAKMFVLGDSLVAQSKVRALALASEKEYLTKDGILNKFLDIVKHLADNTGWGKSTIKGSWQTMEWRFAYETKDGFERGRQNEVLGVSMKDNPGKARGKRAQLILYEEFGKFPNFVETWRTNRPSVEAGPYAFGQQIAFGTGGEEGSNFAGAEKMIYSPDGYRVHGIPNIYDKGMTGQSDCVFFSPEVMNLEGYFDKNGNSDIIGALSFIMYDRWKLKYNTSDPMELMGHIAEHPICIAEAIMRTEGSVFPMGEIKEYLASVKVDKQKFVSSHLTGSLVYGTNGELKFNHSQESIPIREYGVDAKNREGAIEIFDIPKQGIRFRYIIGVDPIDADYIAKGSLGSAFVFDLIEDKIVAEYTGRPRTADAFYEVVLRLSKYYNAEINYENNLKGLYGYFDEHGCVSMLASTPKYLKDTQMLKSTGFGNRSVGTPANKQINAHGRQSLADYMITEKIISNGKDQSTIIKLHTIRSIGLLEESLLWNSEGNFDRISAMGMVMILRQEYQKNIEFIRNPTIKKRKIYNDKLIKRFAK